MGKLTAKELEMLRGVGDALMNYGNAICTKPSKPYKASKSQSLQQHLDTTNALLKIEAGEGVTEDPEMVDAWLAFRNKLNNPSTDQ
jgi:hypothetical protein